MSSDANRPTTLLICDDHKILTDALAMVVERDGSLRMIAAPVHVPEEAIELCGEHQPDVVLMDIVFKGHMDGIKATRRIKEVSPATKVVIMTAHDDDRLLVEAVEAGASGFLGKEEAAGEVLSAAKAAAEGEVLIDPATLTRLLHQVSMDGKLAATPRRSSGSSPNGNGRSSNSWPRGCGTKASPTSSSSAPRRSRPTSGTCWPSSGFTPSWRPWPSP